MFIYLAAPFSWKDKLKVYAQQLEEAGHVCTSRWLEEKAPADVVVLSTDDYKDNAIIDLEDIMDSDRFVVFTVDPTQPILRGGKHFEAGFAYGIGVPIDVIGPNENIFYQLDKISKFNSWDEWFEVRCGQREVRSLTSNTAV